MNLDSAEISWVIEILGSNSNKIFDKDPNAILDNRTNGKPIAALKEKFKLNCGENTAKVIEVSKM